VGSDSSERSRPSGGRGYGAVMSLRYVDPHRRRGHGYRVSEKFGRSPAGQWFARQVSTRLDPMLYRATGGRFTTSTPEHASLGPARGPRPFSATRRRRRPRPRGSSQAAARHFQVPRSALCRHVDPGPYCHPLLIINVDHGSGPAGEPPTSAASSKNVCRESCRCPSAGHARSLRPRLDRTVSDWEITGRPVAEQVAGRPYQLRLSHLESPQVHIVRAKIRGGRTIYVDTA